MLHAAETVGDLILLTWLPEEPGPARQLAAEGYAAIRSCLAAKGAVPLQERVFGWLSSAPCVLEARRDAWSGVSDVVPATYVEGPPFQAGGFAGLHVLAARAIGPPRPIARGGRTCGLVVDTASATFLALSDVGRLVHGRGCLPPAEEVAATLAVAEECLARAGWSYGDVVRTWFYLRDILDWYGAFNQVRSCAYRRFGLLKAEGENGIPASTGIEGRNAAGGWCALDLLAVRPRPGHALSVRRLHGRRQGEASQYGSAFARAVSLEADGRRCIFVSGTASIDEEGASTHPGDFEAQVRHTLEVGEALLEEAGAELKDVRQATAFVKHALDAPAFGRIASRTGLAGVPTVGTVADICRDELLFELDATATVETR